LLQLALIDEEKHNFFISMAEAYVGSAISYYSMDIISVLVGLKKEDNINVRY